MTMLIQFMLDDPFIHYHQRHFKDLASIAEDYQIAMRKATNDYEVARIQEDSDYKMSLNRERKRMRREGELILAKLRAKHGT